LNAFGLISRQIFITKQINYEQVLNRLIGAPGNGAILGGRASLAWYNGVCRACIGGITTGSYIIRMDEEKLK
jgi:hypothetical protein